MALIFNGGSNTISGLANGGLPDGCILDADINGMAASKLSGALPAISGAALTGIDTSTIAFFGRQASAQSISNGTYTKLTGFSGGGSTQNIGSSWDNARFTVASGQEGLYFLCGQSAIDDVQRNDTVNLRFYKNGSQVLGTYATGRLWYSGGSTPDQILSSGCLTGIADLAVGDYVELWVYHNEGSTEWTEEWLSYFGGFKL